MEDIYPHSLHFSHHLCPLCLSKSQSLITINNIRNMAFLKIPFEMKAAMSYKWNSPKKKLPALGKCRSAWEACAQVTGLCSGWRRGRGSRTHTARAAREVARLPKTGKSSEGKMLLSSFFPSSLSRIWTWYFMSGRLITMMATATYHKWIKKWRILSTPQNQNHVSGCEPELMSTVGL